MAGKFYQLKNLKRLVNYPFKLQGLGWMPDHRIIHTNRHITDIFFCISFYKEHDAENDERIWTSFSMIPPGVILNSTQGLLHDELFFIYDAQDLDLFIKLLGTPQFRHSNVSISEHSHKLIQEIRNELNVVNTSGAVDLIDQLALMLITELVITARKKSEDLCMMNLKVHEIASQLEKKNDINELCRKYALSRRSFYREWNRVFTISPTQYLLEKKMRHAEILILETSKTISEIAEESGFSSSVYFHQQFKKRNLSSPLDYRAKYSKMGSRLGR